MRSAAKLNWGVRAGILIACVLVTGALFARPYCGEIKRFKQPDGTVVEVRIWGDEYYQWLEALDGYTVITDKETQFVCYAKLSADGNELVSTGQRAGKSNPAALGLAKGLRINREALKRKVREAYQRMGATRASEQRRLAAIAASTAPGTGALLLPPSRTTLGARVGLCILVDFSDQTQSITQAAVTNFCNQIGYTGFGNNGSVRDYFYDVSNGALTYTNVVTAYFRSTTPKSTWDRSGVFYGDQGRALVTEAVNGLKGLGLLDVSLVSVDASSWIYATNVFYAGTANFPGEGLWPHSWSLAAPLDAGGGKFVYDYQISDMGTELVLGTFCHENGHMLCDFPDLYDYGYESAGVGRYCLMGFGGSVGGVNDKNPSRVCAYLNWRAGWGTATNLTSDSNLYASVTTGANGFYRYAKNSTEYFIVENRYQTGRDAALPSSGLAIWHVDENGSNNNEQMTAGLHYECSLEQADGLYHLENGTNTGDVADLYRSGGSTNFSDTTGPNAHWWDGTSSSLKISQVSAAGATMTFLVGTTVSFTAASQSVSESTTAVTITAQLSAVSSRQVNVPYTLGGTATLATDYSTTANPLVIPAGNASANITIYPINDSTCEGNETVVVTMGTPVNAVATGTTVHTLTITDNDAFALISGPTATPNPAEATAPVQFAMTTNAANVNWNWDFADGATAATANPVHAFAANGTYTVSALATHAVTSQTVGGTVIVTVAPPTPPLISGTMTASGTVLVPFTYPVTVSGTVPVLQAAGLPPGLALNGYAISGIPMTGGAYDVTLTATNVLGQDTKVLKITITDPSTVSNLPPVINGAIQVAPNPAQVGQSVTFTATASDPEGRGLAYTWDFGDGTSGAGASATHAYAAGDLYTVTVHVTDGVSEVTRSAHVAVNGTEPDFGGGALPDEPWNDGGTYNVFSILKGGVKLNFADGTKDALTLSGTLPVPKFFKPDGRKLTLAIGQFTKSFTLGAKGSAAAGACKLKLSGKLKNGVFTATPAKFALTIKGERLLLALEEFGFENASTAKTGEELTMTVIMLLSQTAYLQDAKVSFKSTANRGGTGKVHQ